MTVQAHVTSTEIRGIDVRRSQVKVTRSCKVHVIYCTLSCAEVGLHIQHWLVSM